MVIKTHMIHKPIHATEVMTLNCTRILSDLPGKTEAAKYSDAYTLTADLFPVIAHNQRHTEYSSRWHIHDDTPNLGLMDHNYI